MVEIEFDSLNRNQIKVDFDLRGNISLKAIYYGSEILFLNSIKIEIGSINSTSNIILGNTISHNIGLTETGIKENLDVPQSKLNRIIEEIAQNFEEEIRVTFIGEIGEHQFILDGVDKKNIKKIFLMLLNSNENTQICY
jgi:hypothetical protein